MPSSGEGQFDPDFVASSESSGTAFSSSPDSSLTSSGTSSYCYIVNGASLEQLLTHCPRCGAAVVERSDNESTGMLTCNLACEGMPN